MSLAEAKNKILKGEGMILVEGPTLGWNIARIWWSPRTDFLPRTGKIEKDAFCYKEDPENYVRFIDSSTGIACLVDSFVWGPRTKIYLKKHFGFEECPYVFTGGVFAQRALTEKLCLQKNPTGQ
jgi:hypothetical protein